MQGLVGRYGDDGKIEKEFIDTHLIYCNLKRCQAFYVDEHGWKWEP